MKKKYPKVMCARCGKCCRGPIVPITHKDLARVIAATGKSASAVARFCSIDEMDYDESSGLWINLKSGKCAMALRMREGRCVFQTKKGECTIYAARPMTCRTFPYSIYFENDDYKHSAVSEITLNKVMKCAAKPCAKIDIDGAVANARKENIDDAIYFDIVKKWNRRRVKGGVAEFLSFIKTHISKKRVNDDK